MNQKRKISEEELKIKVLDHQTWIESKGKRGRPADFSGTDLQNSNLQYVNLSKANFHHCDLKHADLSHAVLSSCDLSESDLSYAVLDYVDLENADLTDSAFVESSLNNAVLKKATIDYSDFSASELINANLFKVSARFAIFDGALILATRCSSADFLNASFINANLTGTDFSDSILSNSNLSDAELERVNFENSFLISAIFNSSSLLYAKFRKSTFSRTFFGKVDLSQAIDLDSAIHRGPSELSINCLIVSQGNISIKFLKGCGIPDEWIDYIPSLTGKAIQFYSCFISYSHYDDEFAQRLYADLQNAGIRCWFSPEDIMGGEKLHRQIYDAIRVHDKLILILSENSINSEWVATEIRRCRKEEIASKKQKLFPIRLVNYETIKGWECFDADSGKDLAIEIREYYIPDFTIWKNHDAYKKEFDKLVKALKT